MLSDKSFINIAKEIALASKCVSKQVGAVIVKDGRILSTGYNGTPSGYQNCNSFLNIQKIITNGQKPMKFTQR